MCRVRSMRSAKGREDQQEHITVMKRRALQHSSPCPKAAGNVSSMQRQRLHGEAAGTHSPRRSEKRHKSSRPPMPRGQRPRPGGGAAFPFPSPCHLSLPPTALLFLLTLFHFF